MAKAEDESPNFDEMALPDEELTPVEPTAESSDAGLQSQPLPSDEAVAESVEAVGEFAESEAVATEAAEPQADEIEAEPEKEPRKLTDSGKLPQYLELGGLIGVPVIFLLLATFGIVFFATAFYLIAVGLVPYGMWKVRETNVYSVMLGCSLIAVLTGIYCLWLELGLYHYDVKAKAVKQAVSATHTIDACFLA